MNLAHALPNIRLSDIPQGLKYPNSEAAFRLSVRHNPRVPFEFDKDAVRAAMKARGVTQEALAQHMGWPSNSYVSKILGSGRQVKVDEASKIYAFLDMVPGVTEPVREVSIIGLSGAGTWKEAVRNPLGSMSIPRAVPGKNAFAIEVSGDSMDLLIEHGGYVVVDPDQHNLYDGKTYLIENEEYETTVKRYRSNPARFVPMSTNPEHKEFALGDGHYRVIGRVVWKGGMVD
jgi:phage repressor protein C with HTH and peptisase S24 domain